MSSHRCPICKRRLYDGLCQIHGKQAPYVGPAPGYAPPPDNNPVGTILQFAGGTAPDTYLICNGAAVSRSAYKTLFSVIGTAYGSGDGTTTFNLPDVRGKVPFGYKSDDTDFDALGHTGGGKTHSHSNHTVTQPSNHTVTQPSTHGITQPGISDHPATASAAGGQHRHTVSSQSTQNTKSEGTGSTFNFVQTHDHGGNTGYESSHTHDTPILGHTLTTNVALTNNHSGTAVDAHTGTAVDAHSTTDHKPPYVCFNYIIKATPNV